MIGDKEALELIQTALEGIYTNDIYYALPVDEFPLEFRPTVEMINNLASSIDEVNKALLNFSCGKLNIELPPRTNYLAGSLKQLHSILQHLTWQTQQIAAGDYHQSVDYMGDFSIAFNTMIRQLKEREAQLNADNFIMSTVFDHIESLLIVDEKQRSKFMVANACARRTFGIGFDVDDLSEAMQKNKFLYELINIELSDKLHFEMFDDESQTWYYIIYSQFQWMDSEVLLIYCMDISAQKHRETLLEQDALTDALTGISNRRGMDTDIARVWEQHNRTSISVIIMDIDNFKQYNDKYGHIQGDLCLRMVAACLHGIVSRATDVIARYGGEEFLAMLPNTDSDAACAIAERILRSVQELSIPFTKDEDIITHITVSAGVATHLPDSRGTSTELILAADEALYKAKQRGRNRIVVEELPR